MPTDYNTTEDNTQIELLASKIVELWSKTGEMGWDIVSYTDAELAALKAQLDLFDAEKATVALAKITAFLAENDKDGNNVIDALPVLLASVEELGLDLTVLETAVLEQETKIATLAGDVAGLKTKVDGHTGDIAGYKTRIEALEAREDDAGLSDAEVETIAVAQDRKLLAAIGSKIAAIGFEVVALGKTYPITGLGESSISTPIDDMPVG